MGSIPQSAVYELVSGIQSLCLFGVRASVSCILEEEGHTNFHILWICFLKASQVENLSYLDIHFNLLKHDQGNMFLFSVVYKKEESLRCYPHSQEGDWNDQKGGDSGGPY